jgi:flavin reductase (DIM6/NTAB) family NADH-FMN oxidoreductase RutF
MSIMKQGREALKRLCFGRTLLAQEFTISLPEPQSEISVWLQGLGSPRNVTYRHSMACAEPLVVCLSFDKDRIPTPQQMSGLSLEFRRRDPSYDLLGTIRLKPAGATISLAGIALVLLEVQSSTNYCLSNLRLGSHYLLQMYRRSKRAGTPGLKMSLVDELAAMVMFIRPHPVALGSVSWDTGGNLFTMNLMGDLGRGYVAFALRDDRVPAHLVERIGKIAVCSIPFSHGTVAFQFAGNHTVQSIEWDRLPFPTRLSKTFKFPVPEFSPRVRELQVEKVHKIGSHTLFGARVITSENHSNAPGLSVVHGFYQFWRSTKGYADLEASVRDDAFNKQKPFPRRPDTPGNASESQQPEQHLANRTSARHPSQINVSRESA